MKTNNLKYKKSKVFQAWLTTALIFILATPSLIAQTQLERSVISSGGNESASSSIQLFSTIGEPAVQTVSAGNFIYTQGFQQPISGTNSNNPLQLVFSSTGASCRGRDNGLARIDSIIGCQAPYEVVWSSLPTPFDTIPLDTNQVNSSGQGDSLTRLSPGSYLVEVLSADGCRNSFPFAIGLIDAEACALKFYSGITPNDNRNNQWIIDNVEEYPNNSVTILNRLGNLVWEGEGYNNSTVVWSGENLNGNELPSATYFYIFESESDNIVEKGWIELTR